MPASLICNLIELLITADLRSMADPRYHPKYKTVWCEFIIRGHDCRHGERCTHAHSWQDFRGPPSLLYPAAPDWRTAYYPRAPPSLTHAHLHPRVTYARPPPWPREQADGTRTLD